MTSAAIRCVRRAASRWSRPTTLDAIGTERARDALDRFGHDLWRYRFALPFFGCGRRRCASARAARRCRCRVSRARHGLSGVWLKDEAPNATQSFKARGLALAVTGALALGRRAIALPSAGNAGSAAAAYAAAAGLALPRHDAGRNARGVRDRAAKRSAPRCARVPGTIADAGRERCARGRRRPSGGTWRRSASRSGSRARRRSATRSPSSWAGGCPESILYPTGGGTGLVGMWRAFARAAALGWVTEREPPRLVAVQVERLRADRPRVRARRSARRRRGRTRTTLASGLRVPSPFADALDPRAVRETRGRAVRSREDEMLDAHGRAGGARGLLRLPGGRRHARARSSR